MDPNIQSIIIGLLTNSLSSLLAQIGQKDSKLILGDKLLKKIKNKESSLLPILQQAIQFVAENIPLPSESPVPEVISSFLCSPEAESIVRHIYASKLLEVRDQYTLESLKNEFLKVFYLYVTSYEDFHELSEGKIRKASEVLFNALLDGCEQSLQAAIDDGKLSAHEAKSAFRHHILLDEIATIQENLSLLISQQSPNIKLIFEFEKKYRKQVGGRHSYIIPPNFDRVRKMHIDDLYVSPNFTSKTKNEKTDRKENLSLSQFFSKIHHTVVLGNPGGGKTTLTSKICSEFANPFSEQIFTENKKATPILVILRDYGAAKKTHNCSILDFIKIKANSDYQLQPPSGAFEYLLLNGHAFIIFDGLDELLDNNYRQEISNDVEAFCTVYSSTPVLITSREVGYEQAPLNEEKFEIFYLANFNKEQQKEYTYKWFKTTVDLIPEQQQQKAKDFLKESQLIQDLCSNPLILALLCNIYREENYIPKNRPSVYEKCAIMLFDRWDKHRGIQAQLPFEAHIRPAMMYLAYWIYNNEELRGGVTEEKLVEKATEYLSLRLYEDLDEAKKAALEFIEFCTGRAWIFTNTGSTKNQELYQFTHSTFLEYFTACYLVRTHSTPFSLFKNLQTKIAKQEWDVVAQLAFHIQSRDTEGAGDKLLSATIRQYNKYDDDKQFNFLSFTLRCLEFIIPNPKLTRDIVQICIENILKQGSINIENEDFFHLKPSSQLPNNTTIRIETLSNSLFNMATDNLRTVFPFLEKYFIERLNHASENEYYTILEVALTFEERRRYSRSKASHSFKTLSDNIFNRCYSQVEMSSQKYLPISYIALWQGSIGIHDIAKWHGISSLFSRWKFATLTTSYPSMILQPIIEVFRPTIKLQFLNTFDHIRDIGKTLVSYPYPWTTSTIFDDSMVEEKFFYDKNIQKFPETDSDLLFGIYLIMALIMEGKIAQSISAEEAIETIKTGEYPLFNYIRWSIIARFDSQCIDLVADEMERCIFSPQQQDIIWKWIRKEIYFIQQQPSSKNSKVKNSKVIPKHL